MRLDRGHAPFAGFVAGGSTIIAGTIFMEPTSVLPLLRPNGWMLLLTWAVLPLTAVLAVAWAARLTFVLTRASRTLSRLPRTDELPAKLTHTIARTGVEGVQCISSDLPIAFCAGARRPCIIVSEGLTDELDDRELEAVLVHEHHHAREHEPLMRAAFESAAQVLVFFPIARWWSRRRIERAELRADQAALRRVGPRPVAAALCRLGSAVPAEAAFAGGTELRVAQLLGDPLPRRRPAAPTVAASILGLPLAVAAAGCVFIALAHLLQ